MTRTEDGGMQLVFGGRQITAMLFLIVVAMGMVAALAYVAGRMTTSAQTLRAENARQQSVKSGQEHVIVVDPPGKPGVVPQSTPVKQVAVSTPAAATPAQPVAVAIPAPPAALPKPPETPQAPSAQPAQLYLQVGALGRGMAEVAVENLVRKGFTARIAPGHADGIFRVLVGPLEDAAAMNKTQAALQEAGFVQFFPRRY